jgi:hypothetical protein
MPAIVKLAFPVLLKVTLCAALVVPTFWLLKVRLATERPAIALVPVPVRLSDWGLPAALSVNTTEAVRVPGALGVNLALRVH